MLEDYDDESSVFTLDSSENESTENGDEPDAELDELVDNAAKRTTNAPFIVPSPMMAKRGRSRQNESPKQSGRQPTPTNTPKSAQSGLKVPRLLIKSSSSESSSSDGEKTVVKESTTDPTTGSTEEIPNHPDGNAHER